jgi:hypothetical protein
VTRAAAARSWSGLRSDAAAFQKARSWLPCQGRLPHPAARHLVAGLMLPSAVGTRGRCIMPSGEVDAPICVSVVLLGRQATSDATASSASRPGDGTSPGQPCGPARSRSPRLPISTLPKPLTPRRPPCRSGTRPRSSRSAAARRRVGQYGRRRSGCGGPDEPGSTRKTTRTASSATSMRLTRVQMMSRIVGQSAVSNRSRTVVANRPSLLMTSWRERACSSAARSAPASASSLAARERSSAMRGSNSAFSIRPSA